MQSSIVAVSKERHANQFWLAPKGFAHAAEVHAVPISAQEIGHAARALPLAFVQTEQGYTLVALMGLRPGSNLFVGPDGRWAGTYIPAALRSYPFRLAKAAAQSDKFILGVDEASMLIGTDPAGTPFFDGDRAHPNTQAMLDFLLQVRQGSVTAQRATDALVKANVLEPWPISVSDGKESRPVSGIYRVAETALNGLDDSDYLLLRAAAALPLAYAHLLSAQNFPALERLSAMHQAYRKKQIAEEAKLFTPAMEDEKFDWKALFRE